MNKLEFALASNDTAEKIVNLPNPPNSRDIANIIGKDFDALGIDGKYFDDYEKVTRQAITQFTQWSKQNLDGTVPSAPVPAPAAPAAKTPAAPPTIVAGATQTKV